MKFCQVSLIVALAVAGAGCKKKDVAGEKEPAAAGATTDVTSDRSLQVMNYYVELFNELIGEVPDVARNYWDQAGDAPLTVETMTKWGNVICAGTGWMKMKRDSSKKQLEVAKKASSGEFVKLPPLADAMHATGVAYAEQRDELCKYVKGGEWKTDAGAKAKTFHTALGAARDAWNAAAGGLGAELDRIEDAQSNAELAKHDDKSYGYWFRVTTMRANEFLRLARRDAVKAEAALPKLQAALAAFDAFGKSKGTAVHETFAGYGKQVERFATAATKLAKGLAGAKTVPAKEVVIEKQFDELVSIYNTMISLHNTLVGAEGRGDLK